MRLWGGSRGRVLPLEKQEQLRWPSWLGIFFSAYADNKILSPLNLLPRVQLGVNRAGCSVKKDVFLTWQEQLLNY